MAKNTQFISVNCLDSLFIRGVEVQAGNWTTIVDIEQSSTALTQEPVALDTPIRIEFGAAVNGASDPVMMDATGLITINETNTYLMVITMNFGRTGAVMVSQLMATIAFNGVVPANARPIYAQIDNANLIIPGQFNLILSLTAGDEIEFQLMRDSIGDNSGGLFAFSPTTVAWPDSPTAGIEIARLEPVAP